MSEVVTARDVLHGHRVTLHDLTGIGREQVDTEDSIVVLGDK